MDLLGKMTNFLDNFVYEKDIKGYQDIEDTKFFKSLELLNDDERKPLFWELLKRYDILSSTYKKAKMSDDRQFVLRFLTALSRFGDIEFAHIFERFLYSSDWGTSQEAECGYIKCMQKNAYPKLLEVNGAKIISTENPHRDYLSEKFDITVLKDAGFKNITIELSFSGHEMFSFVLDAKNYMERADIQLCIFAGHSNNGKQLGHYRFNDSKGWLLKCIFPIDEKISHDCNHSSTTLKCVVPIDDWDNNFTLLWVTGNGVPWQLNRRTAHVYPTD